MDATATAKGGGGGKGSDLQASIWPQDEGAIDMLDKTISRCVMELQIGQLEWLLSVPGCFFGMAPILIVGPLTLATLATTSPAVGIGLTQAILGMMWLGILCVWYAFCAGRPELAQKFLYAKHAYLFGPMLGIALARLAGPEAWSVGAWFIIAWSVTLVPVLILKGRTKRRRPAVCVPNLIPDVPRVIKILPLMLTKDANASFPSGDVAGAGAFGATLALGCDKPILGISLVALSALGRMYWRAHHFLDVCGGAVIGSIACVLVNNCLVNVHSVSWWHPILAHVSLVGFMINAHRAVKH